MSKKMKTTRVRLLTFLVAMISLSVSAQNFSVNGVVKDKNGETIIGASVVEKGNSTNGTITDLDGKYELVVSQNSTIVFSYVGMKTHEEKVNGRSRIDIVMTDDAQALEEVVVIGYGSVKRKDLTGSVATVSSETLTAVPVASATEALTGKMAGVQITTTEGSPDAEMKIRVRGGGSITGDNSPLLIVDGFPVESISDIPASDIEDITVLKDASSTAIYGSRGANGVILVTTKSGKEGKVNVSYNAYYSVKKIAKTLDVLSPSDYAKWQYEQALLRGDSYVDNYESFFGSYSDIDLYNNIPYNDWQDLTFGRTGTTFNHNLSITGGSDKIKYAFSYSHMNDKAIMEGSNYKRDNFSLKLNTKPVKNVSLDFSVRYSKTNIGGGGANDVSSTYDSDKRLKYSVIYTPIPLENLDSSAGSSDDDLGNLYHPLTAISDNDRDQERKTLNMSGSFTWEIFKNFKFRTEFGYDDYVNDDQRFYGLTTYYIKNVPSADNQGKPAIQLATTNRHKFRNTNTINYDFSKLFKNDDHNLSAMIGHEWIITKSNKLTNIVHGFPETFTADDAWKLTSMGTPYSIDNFYDPDDKLLSYFGRINYDYQSKYLLSATFRADGSSKFAKGNEWGYFPSAAVAWRISSENFMDGTKNWLDDMKLRFSYGTAGNNNIPSGQMVQTYSNSATSWINGFTNYWAPSKTMANSDLKWETTITRNLGLDFTVLGGRLNGTIEAYLNTTKDLLIQFPVGGTGYDNQYRNMGKTENKGLEATINWVVVDKKNWGISLNANIGFNKNTILDLGMMNDFGAETYWASSEIGNDFWISKGGSVGEMYGYRSDGRYETTDFVGYDATTDSWILKDGVVDCSAVVGKIRPGSMKLKNIDGSEDNKVTTDDREIIGNANPLHTGGFGINARLYGFDLSANFNWSYGNDVYNANKIEFTQTGKYQYRNMTSEMAEGKRWTNLRPDGTLSHDLEELAEMNANTTMWSPLTDRMIFSDWAVEDGSFLRLNTLTLGYTLPKSLLNKVKIQNLRFYITGYNVFCLTSYSGYDPEVSTIRKTNLTPGVDYSAYPKSRQFVVGVNLNF
ncbi:TonB-dependent receptor [Bacteroides caecigallinarum]|uniref:SusC/RagA family TonB-linked outer membrane protein n=1 Tax=Bacteroides caecigallinarum TaxID=1411144 RepID=UPI00195C1328|nr:TonB-dependent receptor [Bacteroides caecigallinarum]MBM6890700.1 TonB-dependent receptor [Bacteroides caecigallinarum]